MNPAPPSRSPRLPRASKPVVQLTPAASVIAAALAPKPTLRRDIFHCRPAGVKESTLPSPFLCIVCATPIAQPTVTMDITFKSDQYVYVAHKGCWDGISERERRHYDRALERLLEEGARL